MAESIIGLFKTEGINFLGPWKSVGQAEWETLKWVDWYNNTRLHSAIGYVTPQEAEEAFYDSLNEDEKAAQLLKQTLSGKTGAVQPARRHRHRRGFRLAGSALQITLRDCVRHHRHTLERLGVLRSEKPSEGRMTKPIVRKLRCAVYTRKSSEEGLEQEFNSLHAQRDACEAYIASQRSEGWVLVRDQYDDGGISGGTLDRPGLQQLMADIEDGLVDVVVVYKIDRLSRSLAYFAKLVEVFDRNDVTFVSVTQSFNTTTSMGRLTLNILLSFAQFEREVTAERIRDKVAASRKKGTWKAARADTDDIAEADARVALQQLDPVWDELFPAEQARIVALLIERIDIGTEGLNVRFRIDGLGGLAREMQAGGIEAAA